MSIVSVSQEKGKKIVQKDTISLKYNFLNKQEGGLFLTKPTKKVITYDQNLNKFVVIEKIGEYEVSY
ncbi:MAG: hypothetical protein CR961_02070 [Polaribacter sp.]|nr:MAG: hypothetical protein CR961_02070 [Polaribacter sp.]